MIYNVYDLYILQQKCFTNGTQDWNRHKCFMV